MCRISLEEYDSRDADVGESLELRPFPSGSVGLAKDRLSTCVVCVQPGAELLLRNVSVQTQRQIGILEPELKAVFDEREQERWAYTDGLVFENGRFLLFQELISTVIPCIEVEVMSIPGQPQAEHSEQSTDHVAFDEEPEPVHADALTGAGVSTLVYGVSVAMALGFIIDLVT